jgi:hypothetical protein
VHERSGEPIREVFESGRTSYESLRSTGLYDRLVRQGLLIPHRELARDDWNHPDTWLVLAPERVPFISYTYEWCFSQLRDAALATLQVQEEALKVGLTLKDAVPENIQFLRGRPILIDTLSFEPAHGAWEAYYQFCRRFLAPLVLVEHCGPECLDLLAAERDGVSLEFASGLLPRRTWLKPALMMHLHMHARANQSTRPAAPGVQTRGGDRTDISRQRALIDSLRRAVDGLRWKPPETEWTRYESEQPTYTADAWTAREQVIAQVLDRVQPGVAWDLGAALGHASRLAASKGALTVAFDGDHSCVELMWRSIREAGEQKVLPLRQDLLRPTPRTGWAEQEQKSLSDRGPADLLMALGIFHHLNIRGGVPADMVFEYFAKLGRAALVEFVPGSDPIVRDWCGRFRREPLAEEAFRAAAEQQYGTVERLTVTGSDRVLYLCLQRRHS